MPKGPDLSNGVNVLEFTRTHAADRVKNLDEEIRDARTALMKLYYERAVHQALSDVFDFTPKTMAGILPKLAILHADEDAINDLTRGGE